MYILTLLKRLIKDKKMNEDQKKMWDILNTKDFSFQGQLTNYGVIADKEFNLDHTITFEGITHCMIIGCVFNVTHTDTIFLMQACDHISMINNIIKRV